MVIIFFNFLGQWRCNFSKNHYLILEFLEFVYSCKERRMPHSVEYFGRPCAKKVQIILIFWHAKIDKNICERIHGKKRLKKFWLVGFFCFFLQKKKMNKKLCLILRHFFGLQNNVSSLTEIVLSQGMCFWIKYNFSFKFKNSFNIFISIY